MDPQSDLKPMERRIKRLGWIPDIPDQRDHLYAAPVAALGALPAAIDLVPACPPIYDQGDLGGCTANAIAAAVQFDQAREHLKDCFLPSRLFIYYNERVIEHHVESDSGAMIRDGIKSVARLGVCPETSPNPVTACWPYDIAKFAEKPPQPCYDEALHHKAVLYQRLTQSLDQMKGCLASGYPFVFGFAVYESFESEVVARTGHAPMPGPAETMLGGHAVLAVGYDEQHQWFIVRNSWGPEWGMNGYFTLPYAYLLDNDLSDDYWTIRLVQ